MTAIRLSDSAINQAHKSLTSDSAERFRRVGENS